MYGVPEYLDLTPFVGTTLDYIGIGAYQINFVFSGDIRTEKDRVVNCYGRWELRDARSELIDKAMDNSEREAYKVHRLLSKTVAGAAKKPPESFSLVFDDESTLTFFDDFNGYDSCDLQIGDKEIHF